MINKEDLNIDLEAIKKEYLENEDYMFDVELLTDDPFQICLLSLKETGEILLVYKEMQNTPMSVIEWEDDRENFLSRIGKDNIIKTVLYEKVEEKFCSEVINRIIDYIKEKTDSVLLNDISYEDTLESEEHFERLQFEKTPMLWPSTFESHYLKMKPREFDKVDVGNLSCVYLEKRFIYGAIEEVTYGNNGKKYYDLLLEKLNALDSKIMKGQFTKSVKSWIYVGDGDLGAYLYDEKKAESKLDRYVPVYHMLDVLKALENIEAAPMPSSLPKYDIHPTHRRCPVTEIKIFEKPIQGDNESDHDYYERRSDWKDFQRKWTEEMFSILKKINMSKNDSKDILRLDKLRERIPYKSSIHDVYMTYGRIYQEMEDYDNYIALLLEYMEVLDLFEDKKDSVRIADQKEKIEKDIKKAIKKLKDV